MLPASNSANSWDIGVSAWVSVCSVSSGLLPTVGLFIASIRSEEATKTTGWWKALTPISEFTPVRSGTEAELLDDGRYVIRGTLVGDEELVNAELGVRFGIRSNLAEIFNIGDTIDLGEYISSRAGLTLTVFDDYSYEISSVEPIELRRGQNIFIESTIPPTFTTDHYRVIIEADADSDYGIGRAFLNTFTVTIPATIIPITIAGLRRLCLLLDEIPVSQFPFHRGRCAVGGATADGPHPHFTHLQHSRVERYLPGYLVGAYRFWIAIGDLPSAQLHRWPAAGNHGIRQYRWRDAFSGFHTPGPAAIGAGPRQLCDFPVPLGLE